eukprot:365458-Chlamydomonas_euryale.AAC.2
MVTPTRGALRPNTLSDSGLALCVHACVPSEAAAARTRAGWLVAYLFFAPLLHARLQRLLECGLSVVQRAQRGRVCHEWLLRLHQAAPQHVVQRVLQRRTEGGDERCFEVGSDVCRARCYQAAPQHIVRRVACVEQEAIRLLLSLLCGAVCSGGGEGALKLQGSHRMEGRMRRGPEACGAVHRRQGGEGRAEEPAHNREGCKGRAEEPAHNKEGGKGRAEEESAHNKEGGRDERRRSLPTRMQACVRASACRLSCRVCEL